MGDRCLVLNTGSRKDSPINALIFSKTRELAPVIDPLELAPITVPHGTTFKQIAAMVVPQLEDIAKEVDFILFRCPALTRNIKGLTLATPKMEEVFPRELVLNHGSEIGFWVARELSKEFGIPAVFSRGIPTSHLPKYAVMTGHPKIQSSCLSHWEAVEGIALRTAYQRGVPLSEVAFILVMIGSGIGVYAWENEAIVSFHIRQWGSGPMSQSSIGGSIDSLSLMKFLVGEGITDLNEAIKRVSLLAGKEGGLQLYNREWGDLREFRASYEAGDKLAEDLLGALVFQIVSCIGTARFSLYGPGSLDTIPIYFFGGGAKWPELTNRIKERANASLFSFETVEDDPDPEIRFFASQAREYAMTEKAIPYDDLLV